jgi:hypothetical protein
MQSQLMLAQRRKSADEQGVDKDQLSPVGLSDCLFVARVVYSEPCETFQSGVTGLCKRIDLRTLRYTKLMNVKH